MNIGLPLERPLNGNVYPIEIESPISKTRAAWDHWNLSQREFFPARFFFAGFFPPVSRSTRRRGEDRRRQRKPIGVGGVISPRCTHTR
ncbi:MAG: hypothetical protein CM1200mP2_45350 [Planctomycetaceae bacterium]|nr:MAG: hypothetical protein CM1200mP2_45350 [Planctomycetaceae bacterium]